MTSHPMPFIISGANIPAVPLNQLDYLRMTKSYFNGGIFKFSFGAGGFLISGSYLEADLPLSIGFLNIPAFLVFFPITAFMARLGAKASHRVDKMRMTKYF